MSGIASVAAMICSVAIASSLIALMVPQGSTKRVLYTVIGVFVICSLIVPVKNVVTGFDLNIDIPKLSDSLTASGDEAYKKALTAETESKLKTSLVSYLYSKGYKIKNAVIKVNTNKKTGIYIEHINIYINRKDLINSGEIISLTENKFERTPKITVT